MPDRQHAEHRSTRLWPSDATQAAHLMQQVGVAKRNTLGLTGGARGVKDGGCCAGSGGGISTHIWVRSLMLGASRQKISPRDHVLIHRITFELQQMSWQWQPELTCYITE